MQMQEEEPIEEPAGKSSTGAQTDGKLWENFSALDFGLQAQMPMALLLQVMGSDVNKNQPHIKISEGQFTGIETPRWTYLTPDGWHLTCYWVTALNREPEHAFQLLRQYQGNCSALANQGVRRLCPPRCFLLSGAQKGGEESLIVHGTWIALAQKTIGKSLRHLAETTANERKVREIIESARAHVQTIHLNWGFSGGCTIDSIFYDTDSRQVMFLDWARSHLPVKHWPSNAISGVQFPYSHLMKTPVKFNPFQSFDQLALLHCFVCCLDTLLKRLNPRTINQYVQQLEEFVRRAAEGDIAPFDAASEHILEYVLRHPVNENLFNVLEVMLPPTLGKRKHEPQSVEACFELQQRNVRRKEEDYILTEEQYRSQTN